MSRPEGAPPRALHAGAAAPDGADGGRSQTATICMLAAQLQGTMTMARGMWPTHDGGVSTEMTRLEHPEAVGGAGSADSVVIIFANFLMKTDRDFWRRLTHEFGESPAAGQSIGKGSPAPSRCGAAGSAARQDRATAADRVRRRREQHAAPHRISSHTTAV